MHAGIPDFRVSPDPFLDFEQDRDRTEKVLAVLDAKPLPELLGYYWSLSAETPPALRQKFVASALRGEHKARRVLRMLEGGTFRRPVRAATLLEIGCGSGAFLAEAAPRFRQVVGVDIAMRWLQLSRRRFMDREIEVPPLVCCCAESLPFADAAFDVVVSYATLEFARDPDGMLSECARTLRDDGSLLLNTVNRFSIAREPHAQLWGVGFLPRRWQARYVRWRGRGSFENVHLLSYRELGRLAARYFERREVALADIADEALAGLPFGQRLQVRIYRILKWLPALRWLLERIGPEWDVLLSQPGPSP